MENVEYLPLGSLVKITDTPKRLMIIARAVQVKIEDKEYFFDYGACTYPEGLIGDQVFYFQHKDIEKVIHKGFSDFEDKRMTEKINDAIEQIQPKHADVVELRKAK